MWIYIAFPLSLPSLTDFFLLIYTSSSFLTTIMSKLNIGASEFVPGRFRTFVPQAPLQPPPPDMQPIERPEQTEAPAKPPTISLSIGGSKPAPPPAAKLEPVVPPAKVPVAAPTAPVATPAQPKATVAQPAAAQGSKTFTTERAKTDATAVHQEVHSIVDQETLKDLYGDG